MNPYSIRFIGTATVLIQYGDLTIITDPALDAKGDTYDIGFATLEKTGSPILTRQDLPEIDLVLLSHDQHADNLDHKGRELLADVPLVLTTEDGAERLGENATGLAFWETYQVGDVTVTAMPSQHGPEEALDVLGPTIGFLITSEAGPTVYISGDTVPFSGTEEIVSRYGGQVDYALLHTGAVAQGEDDDVTYFTMTASEAIELATALDANRFSIVHADSWDHYTEKMPAALEIAHHSAIEDRLLNVSDGQPKVFSSKP